MKTAAAAVLPWATFDDGTRLQETLRRRICLFRGRHCNWGRSSRGTTPAGAEAACLVMMENRER